MTVDNHRDGEEELTPKQTSILEGFVGHYAEASERTPRDTSYYDLFSANLREHFTEGFGLPLDTRQRYYAVMAGISIGTVWIEQLVDRGLTVEQAADAVRNGFARLFPQDSTASDVG